MNVGKKQIARIQDRICELQDEEIAVRQMLERLGTGKLGFITQHAKPHFELKLQMLQLIQQEYGFVMRTITGGTEEVTEVRG